MKKKVLSLLLTLCLAMTFVPMATFAEGTSVDNWDGTADTSWYTDHKTDTEYHFTTAEQLAGLAQLVNDKTASVSFEGKTIYLDNDLDLSGCQWTPIGNGSNFGRYFAGTFDGQYHKITNLHLGHIQRGGNASAKDRVMATRMGYEAVQVLAEGKTNCIICAKGEQIINVDIDEGLAMKKTLNPEEMEVMTVMSGR